ncbi:hypothetical protein EYZ11_010270 [Aspergillus tanneri]|uniref:Uncharacterized protein n=1 Tax=Aspergillus tanneri TaxID=1220188 RepID=A0A4S3J6A8_9EURO|nr:hypothetical protein EYZ11_010270 [Aspergillus tanneri]
MAASCSTNAPPNWDPPPGWGNDAETLDPEFYWSESGDGTRVTRALGLDSPSAVMCQTSDFLYLFESKGVYYVWNRVEGDVWKITSPQAIDAIVASIKSNGVKSLQMQLVT